MAILPLAFLFCFILHTYTLLSLVFRPSERVKWMIYSALGVVYVAFEGGIYFRLFSKTWDSYQTIVEWANFGDITFAMITLLYGAAVPIVVLGIHP